MAQWTTQNSLWGGTFSVSASVSGSTVSASGSMTDDSTMWYGYSESTIRLALLIGGSEVASVGIPKMTSRSDGIVFDRTTGETIRNCPKTVSVSGSRSVSDGNITVSLVIYCSATADYLPINGQTTSTSVTVSTWSNGSLTVSGEATLNGSITVNATAGKNNTISTPTWSITTDETYTGTASKGDWQLNSIDLWDAVKNYSGSQVTVKLTSTQKYGGSLTTSFSMSIPSEFGPRISVDSIEYVNPQAGALIAGQSAIKINYTSSMYPDNSQATISSLNVSNVVFTPNDVASSLEFTYDSGVIESSILPSYTSASSYNLALVITAIDTMGHSFNLTIQPSVIGKIYCYIPPQLIINNISRAEVQLLTSEPYQWEENYRKYYCLQDDKFIKNTSNVWATDTYYEAIEKVGGTYCLVSIRIVNEDYVDNDIILSIASTFIDNVNEIYQLGYESGTPQDSIYSGIVGNYINASQGSLSTGEQYEITISIKNRKMEEVYHDDAITITNLLSTMQMPISLYDNGYTVGVSVGEMATKYEDLNHSFLNFAKDLYLRAMGDDDDVVSMSAYDLLTKGAGCPFPIGAIYLTLDTTDPSNIWQGTNWILLNEGQFLLSAGSEYALGSTGGEEEHTLTIDEMPSHTHNATIWDTTQRSKGNNLTTTPRDYLGYTITTSATGGGQPHNNMPPYLAVYMWQRIEDPVLQSYFSVNYYGLFEYEDGMTWNEFIASDYNQTITGEYKRFIIETIDGSSVISIGHQSGSSVYYDEQLFKQSNRVNPSARIINNYEYTTVIDGIEFDYVSYDDADEVDILYTADTHLAWLGYNAYRTPQKYVPQDIKDAKDALWNSGIPTFAVDCGDFDHGQNAPFSDILDLFNNFGSVGYNKYLSVTFGNHEWYAAMGTASTIVNTISQVDNMTACNFLHNGEPVFKPYRAVRIGNCKIGVIAVGYPSPNGRNSSSLPENSDVHTWSGYTWHDATRNTPYDNQPSSALYTTIQSYIDLFKAKHFDFVLVNSHIDMNQYEDLSADSRFNTRAEYIINNTNGIDVLIPGHLNDQVNTAYTMTHLDGVHQGIIAQEALAGLGSYGRIRLDTKNKTITTELV